MRIDPIKPVASRDGLLEGEHSYQAHLWIRREAGGPRPKRVERYGQTISVSAAKLLDRLVEMNESGMCTISNEELSRSLRWKHAVITARLRELEQAQLISRHIDRHVNRPGKRVIELLCL